MEEFARRREGGALPLAPEPAPEQDSTLASMESFARERNQTLGRLRASARVAAETTPQRAAQIKYLSEVTRLPQSVVETEEGEAKARARFEQLRSASEHSPVLRQRLLDPAFSRLVEFEDAEKLSAMEQGIRVFGEYVLRPIGGEGMGRLNQSVYGGLAAAADLGAWATSPLVGRLLPANPFGPISDFLHRRAQLGSEWAKTYGLAAGDYGGPVGAGVASGVSSLWNSLLLMPLGVALQGEQAIAKVGGMAVPSMRSLLPIGAQTAGGEYSEAIQQGLSGPRAAAYAIQQGGVEMATEALPTGEFMKALKGEQGFLKTLGKVLVEENVGEQIATAWQDLNTWIYLNPEKSLADYLDERPDAALQTAIATTFAAGLQSGAVHLISKAQQQQEAVSRAQEELTQLQSLFRTAAGVNVRELDKKNFADFVQAAANNSPNAPKSVFVDGRVLAETLAQAGVSEEELTQMLPSVPAQLADAARMNGTVEIPIGEAMASLPGTPLEKALLPDLRMREDGLSLNEAKDAQKRAQEFFAHNADRVLRQAADTAAVAASMETVRQRIKADLDATGRFSSDVNDRGARLAAQFYAVMGSRMGMRADQLYDTVVEYRVKGEGQGSLTQDLNVRLQEKIDKDYAAAVAEYAALEDSAGGKVMNTDLARELSQDYRADRSRAAQVHEAASAFIKRMWAEKLAKPAVPNAKGEAPYVLFTAGGTGAGKTTALRTLPGAAAEAEIVYDGTMDNFESTDKKLRQALAAGRDVNFVYVYRDPVDALAAGALPRAMSSGRTVPVEVLRDSHLGSRQVVEQLMQKYANDPRVAITIIDNSKGPGKAEVTTLDALPAMSYNDLGGVLNEILENQRQSGAISEEVYRGFRSQPGPSAGLEAGQGFGGKPQQANDGARESETLNQSVTTMVPTTKGAVVDPALVRVPGLAEAEADTAKARTALAGNVALFNEKTQIIAGEEKRGYDSISVEGSTPKQKAESIINQMVRNLLTIFDAIPESIRSRSRLWYDGANRISLAFAQRYGMTPMQAAAQLAVLSPQADWFMNVSYAERINDILDNQQDYTWDEGMEEWATEWIDNNEEARDKEAARRAQAVVDATAKVRDAQRAQTKAAAALERNAPKLEQKITAAEGALREAESAAKAAKKAGTPAELKRAEKLRDKRNEELKAAKLALREARSTVSKAATAVRNNEKDLRKKIAYAAEPDANLEVQSRIRGKKLSELQTDFERAWWVRTYDEVHNPRSYRVVTPEGGFLDFVKIDSGANDSIAWKSFAPIAKAISIRRDGSLENVHDMLGGEHKVRNFYNNIYAPDAPFPFVTSDTHQVAANLFLPLGADALEVGQNFGGTRTKSVGEIGLNGTYWLYSEAVARAAKQRDVLPREMQSISWEAIRSLFSPSFKANSASVNAVRDLWSAHHRGEATYEETIDRIIQLAGGRYRNPSWVGVRPDSAAAPEYGSKSYQSELSHARQGLARRDRPGPGDSSVSGSALSAGRDTLAQSYAGGRGHDRGVAAGNVPRYGRTDIPGAISIRGVHYSSGQRQTLDSSRYGTGARGDEAQRLNKPDADPRIRQRVYFYVDEGAGVVPESGVGYNAHEVDLDGLYDAKSDPLGLAPGKTANEFEAAVLDAGFIGYAVGFGRGKAAVLLGEHSVPVQYAGMGARPARTQEAANAGRLEQAGNGRGREEGRNLAPLEGAPSVPGFNGPDSRLVEVAERYAAANGIQLRRQAEYARVDPERAARIAAAYEAMPHAPQDPAVREAYENLIRQTRAQYDALAAAGYSFWFLDLNRPDNLDYASTPWNAMRDVRKNQQMGVFPTADGFGTDQAFDPETNPLLEDTGLRWPVGGPNSEQTAPVTANDLFRAVHDAFGHGLEGAGFRAQGEENAWQAHVRLFTASAIGAITSETRGQNSWLNYGPHGEANRTAKVEDTVFADQKTGLMPEWTWAEGRVGDMPDTLEQSAPGFYSALARGIESLPTKSATPQGWKDAIKGLVNKGQAKVDEVEWTGVNDWLDLQQGRVTKEQVAKYLQQGGVRVEEVVLGRDGAPNNDVWEPDDGLLGNTRYGDYVIPGGTNYREVLLTLPVKSTADPAMNADAAQNFRSGHWDQPNVLAHIRVNDRVDADGKRVLFVEEIQSDWGQEGRDKGFADKSSRLKGEVEMQPGHGPDDPDTWAVVWEDNTQHGGYATREQAEQRLRLGENAGGLVPRAPFVGNTEGWLNLALKRVVTMAVEGNYDRVAFINGEQSADRYDLSKQVDKITVSKAPSEYGKWQVVALKGVEFAIDRFVADDEELASLIGKELAEKAIAKNGGSFAGLDLKVGGKGMKTFYDQIVPAALKKLLPKVGGGKLETVSMERGAPSRAPRAATPFLDWMEVNHPEVKRVDAARAWSMGIENNTYVQEFFETIRWMQQPGFDVTDAVRAKVAGGVPLFQNQNQAPRGTYDIASMTTVLNGTADLSTFLHETGHFFLDAIRRMVASGKATPEIVAMYQSALKGLGVSEADWEKWHADYDATGKISDGLRAAHEKWAESFELYLFTGKAPSPEMRGLFRTFASWLKRVYQSVQAFAAKHNRQLDPDLVKVMDKMLATDEQIAEAEQMAGLLPDLDATAEAQERLNARSLRDLKWAVNARNKMIAKLQKEVAAKRKEVEAEARAEVEQFPIYRAEMLLRYGRLTGTKLSNAQRKQMDQLAGMKLKLGLPQLKEMYGEGPAAPWRYLPLGKNGLAAAEGVHPDVLADALGFPSGDALVRGLLSAEKIDSVVEGLTDQRMLERYGDIATPEAIADAAAEAVHNQARARSLATELSAQAEMLNPRQDTGKTNAKGQRITVNALVEAAKQFGENVIGRRKVKDLKKAIWSHVQAERRAGKEWQEATAKGDTKGAVQAKQDQMLNNAAVRAGQAAQERVRKAQELFRRVTKGTDEKLVERGYDPDIANAARVILAAYGIAPAKGQGAAEYLEVLKRSDPQTYAVVAPSVTAALLDAKPFEDLTVDEMEALRDEIESLWHLARRSRQMEVDGDLLDREDVQDELKSALDARGVPARVPGEGSAITPIEQAMRKLLTFRAAATRVESWAKNLGSAFTRYVFEPVKDAADRYRADRTNYLKRYRALLDAVAPSMRREVIAAPELGYVFGKDTGGVAMSEILHSILHTGNDSNKRKLLLGRGWASENQDGTLDTTQWDAFLARMIAEGKITKAHYDFAQGVWDLLEAMKPAAQQTHRDVFGRYFAEVTANAFTTPFGTYRGGYVPAIADGRIVSDKATRDLAEAENESLAFAFPTTNRGFTKSRVEYNRPLLLDLRTLAQHMDKVLLFTHLERPVRDVRRVLTSNTVGYGLNRIDPVAFDNVLTPWLNRAARQQVETPTPGDAGLMRVLSAARNRAGMAAMFANIANAAQQITGFSLAGLRVKPSHLLSATAEMIAHPKRTKQAVADASVYMRERMENEASNAETAIRDILLNPSVYDKAKAWSARHAYFLQQAVDNVMGPIIWTAAFNQSLAKGAAQKDAVRFADSVIRTTQGSTLPEDVSRIEGGNAFVRLFTQFAGYFNMQANLLGTEFADVARDLGVKKGAGRMLYIALLGFLAPAWVAEAIVQVFRGGPDDDDKDGDYLDDWLAAVLGWAPVRTATAMIPGVGQVINSAVNAANTKPYDDRIASSPAISMIESAARSATSVYKSIVDDGSAQKAVRDVAALITLSTGLPASAVARPVGYAAGMADDRINPTGGVDTARGLLTGVASPGSK